MAPALVLLLLSVNVFTNWASPVRGKRDVWIAQREVIGWQFCGQLFKFCNESPIPIERCVGRLCEPTSFLQAPRVRFAFSLGLLRVRFSFQRRCLGLETAKLYFNAPRQHFCR